MKKKFDAIAFKRKVQKEIYEEIKDLSPDERVEYFNKAGEEFRREMEKLRKQKKTDKQPKSGKKASGKAV
jgi:hypothetical protein